MATNEEVEKALEARFDGLSVDLIVEQLLEREAELAEARKKPEPTDETQSIRRQYNMAMNNTKLIIDEDNRQFRMTGIEFQYGELLRLCDIIDRLTAEKKDLKESLKANERQDDEGCPRPLDFT